MFDLVPTGSPVPPAQRSQMLADPGFGRYFTDHMATATWRAQEGWSGRQIRALEPFSLHPAAGVFHYGQAVFEGLKAYRHPDGSVRLFRPQANAARLARSATRLALPPLPEQDFLDAVTALVSADRGWVPPAGGERSLYLRPFLIATEAYLGVRPSAEAAFGVIASPAGAYFSGAGVRLWVSTDHARAAVGGTGDAKCGGNYAASLVAQTEARERGYDQVLYLDGAGGGRLDESGTMNVFLISAAGELVTPALGSILAGITRDSLLALAGEHGLRPVQREVPLAEVRQGLASGAFTEMFASGTAAVVTPIVGLAGADGEGEWSLQVGDGTPGPRTAELRAHLVGIQQGDEQDSRGWLVPVD